MSTYDWLLFLHVTGAFLVIGGIVAAAVFNLAAQGRERPSEVALLFGLTRVCVVSIMVGMTVALIFGLWLVHHVGYGYGDGWIVGSLVLWVAANALSGAGGRRDRETRALAERLAAEGDAPSTELRARVRDPRSVALSYAGGIAALAILVLMIWKPGAT